MSSARLPWSAARCTTVAIGAIGVYDIGLTVAFLPSIWQGPPPSPVATLILPLLGVALIVLRTRIPRWLGLRPGACSLARAREDFLVATLAVLAIWHARFGALTLLLFATTAVDSMQSDWAYLIAEAAAVNTWLVLLLVARRLARWLYRRPALRRAVY